MVFKDKVALITGASSGIGEALARELAAQGANLALVARRKDRLDNLDQELKQNTQILKLAVDVTHEDAMRQAVEATVDHFGRLDVVVANAGRAVSGRIEELSIESFRAQLETNVFGVLNTIYPSLKALQQSRGHLVILGSVMSYVSFGGSAPYSMSKYAVRALAEALYHELKPQGVSVTLVCPGMVDSEIRRVDNRGHFHEEVADPVPAWVKMPKATAARKILRAAASRKRELLLTQHGRLGIWLKSWFPGLFHWLVDTLKIRSGKQRVRL